MENKVKEMINNELLLITALVYNSPLREKIKVHITKIKELVDLQNELKGLLKEIQVV